MIQPIDLGKQLEIELSEVFKLHCTLYFFPFTQKARTPSSWFRTSIDLPTNGLPRVLATARYRGLWRSASSVV